jgi:DNA-binding transcriptional MerR regulator
MFAEEDVRRLEFIALCRFLDLPLREIGDLLRTVEKECCGSAQPRLRRLLGKKLEEVDRRIMQLQGLRQRLDSYYQRMAEAIEGRVAVRCTPTTSPIECAFDDARQTVDVKKPAPETTSRLTLQRLETPNLIRSDASSPTKEEEKMCGCKSEGKDEMTIGGRQSKQQAVKAQTEKAKSSPTRDGEVCCEPLCPDACG